MPIRYDGPRADTVGPVSAVWCGAEPWRGRQGGDGEHNAQRESEKSLSQRLPTPTAGPHLQQRQHHHHSDLIRGSSIFHDNHFDSQQRCRTIGATSGQEFPTETLPFGHQQPWTRTAVEDFAAKKSFRSSLQVLIPHRNPLNGRYPHQECGGVAERRRLFRIWILWISMDVCRYEYIYGLFIQQ